MYLGLMARHLRDSEVRILAYCLMSNHVHFVLVPERLDSLAVLFRRVHGAYSQAVNAGLGRSGHLWQNRYYSCPLSERHLWFALRYVEANPVRAGLSNAAEDYRWSSAAAHMQGLREAATILDWDFWERSGGLERWRRMHAVPENEEQKHALRRCTYGGRPFGEEDFVAEIEERFRRRWRRWGFEKAAERGAF